jgi:hypothetical protein
VVAPLCFFLTLRASPFKSNSRLEAENAALRHQLMVLQRKVRGRVHFTISRADTLARQRGASGLRSSLGRLHQLTLMCRATNAAMRSNMSPVFDRSGG